MYRCMKGLLQIAMCRAIRALLIPYGLLLIGLDSWTQNPGSIGARVVSATWFFDLLSLTQPRAMQIINTNQPAKRNVLQQMDEVGHTVETHDPGSFPGRKSIRETPGHILFQSQVSNPYQSASSTSDTTGLSNDLGTRSYLSPSSVNPGLVALPDRSSLLAQEVAICQALTGLTNKQRQICLQHSGLVWAMLEGTRLGLHECVYQFKHEQWNCSAVNILYQLQTNSASIPKVSGLEGILQRALETEKLAQLAKCLSFLISQPANSFDGQVASIERAFLRPSAGPNRKDGGSRETAFLSSTWSAGVVQAITRACSRGQMGTCDCDPARREGQDRDAEGVFTWGGCSDPIRFGMRLTRLFLDATDREHRQAAIEREEELHGPLIRRGQRKSRGSYRSLLAAQQQQQRPRNHPYGSGLKSFSMRSYSATDQTLLSSSDSKINHTDQNKIGSGSHKLSPQEVQAETLRIIQTKARALMNLHNRRAGRKLVWDNRVRKCKCHGVSGACSMRTCWQRVNEFRRVGSMLKSAYDDAIRVTYEPRGDRLKPVETYDFHNRLPSGYSARTLRHEADRLMNARPRVDWLMPVRKYTVTSGNSGGFNGGSASPFPSTITPESISRRRQRWPRSTATMVQVSKAKLVYLEESPNYCRYDPSIGHLGIAGRLCNASSSDAPNSCSRLCCDHGYDKFEYESERKCDCKFFWCCEVRCKICRERTVEHRCKH